MHFYAAEFPAALEHFEKGIDLYDLKQHRAHALRYEHDPGMTCLGYAARTRWLLGHPDQAVLLSEQALDIAKATSHASSVVEAITWRSEVALFRHDVQDTRDRAAGALALAIEHGLPLWTAMTTSMQGWAISEQGLRAEGVARIRDGLATLATTGDKLFRPYYVAMLAEALGKAGQSDEALSSLDEAIDSSRVSGLSYWDAAVYRLKGQLLLATDASGAAGAQGCFLRAIEIAQAQSAKSLELRAATSLARLWADRGERQKAFDLLAPVYGWFTEGFDTADLKDAKALLDALG